MTSIPPPSPEGPQPSSVQPAQRDPAPAGRRPLGAWPAWMGLVALLSGYAATLLGTIVIVAVASAAGADVEPDLPADLNIALTVFQDVALVAAALLFARTVSRPSAREFGLRVPARVGHAIGVLFAVWGAFFLLSAAWTLALNLHEHSDLPERLGVDDSTANLLMVTLLVCVVAPLGEEIFFRGFFYGSLRNWRGPWPAAILTGLTFGAVHLGSAPVGQLVPLAIFGVGLCLLYEQTGSLYPCVALHAVNNAIAFGAGEQHWRWWIVLLAIAGVLALSLALAAAVGRLLGGGSRGARGGAPALAE